MYTKVLLLPWLFVAPVHAAPLDPFGGAIFGAAVLVVVTVPVIWCLARKQRALCALIAALAGPIVALSLLASTARFALEVTAADRYLLPFMPAFLGALCLCAAKIRAATRTRPRAFRRLLPLAVAAMALAGCTFDRTYAYAWYDKTIFWGSVWVRNHDSSMAAVSWSADLFGRGQIEPALAVLKLRSDALRESHSPFAEPTLYWNQLVIGTYAERLGDAGRSEAALAELRYWISERRVVTPILLRVLAMDRARLGECAEARKLSDLVESSADTSFMFISSDDEKNKLHALLDACWQRE